MVKALSFTQPWASLVAIGAKKIETRNWSTGYRGPVVIHAAKSFPAWARELCITEPFATVLRRGGHRFMSDDEFAFGAGIAIARLVDVRRIDMALRAQVIATGLPNELDFGNYETGRYAWFLDDVQPFPTPIPAKGALGLWDWTGPLPVVGGASVARPWTPMVY